MTSKKFGVQNLLIGVTIFYSLRFLFLIRIPAETLKEEPRSKLFNQVKPEEKKKILQQVETKKNDTRFIQGLDSTHGKCSY